jgi:FKBP-type peptidyl-prolyl cis-trans isomerase FkpA
MKNIGLQKIFLVNLLIVISLLAFSCNDKPQKKEVKTKEEIDNYKESLQKANRYLTTLDAERIANYVKRRKWNMKETKSGIWYEIYEKGDGEKAKEGQIAVLNFKISLLDGTLCYTSDSIGAKEFAIGHGGVESGLEEGILLLHQGDKARIIMPPFRAHGLLGDMEKIPPRSIIVYELELLKLIN